MHRSPVVSNNLFDVLDLDMGDDDSDVADLGGSLSDLAVLMVIIMPTLDGTAKSAMDTHNINGRTTLALTNADMFDGSSTTASLDSGNQLPAVLRSAAALDELETTTSHLNGAVAGSQMTTTTHKRVLRLAPGIVLPAVVCPGVAANLVGMLPMLNARPDLSLTIDAAAAGAHVCIVRDSRTNDIVFRLPEDRGVLPLQLPASGTGLLDLAEELDHE
jgi:hypothetical protein